MAKKFPIFNKYFIILMTVNFSVAFYITFVTTTSYAINFLHTSNALAGLASGIFIIGALFARIIFGSYADELYLKPVLIIFLLIYFITTLLYIFIDIGGGIGPYIFGFAGENLGYKAMYQICAGLVFIVLILYFFLIFKRKNC